MGNTCTTVVDSSQCMAKPVQYCKVINLELKSNKFILKNFLIKMNKNLKKEIECNIKANKNKN